MSQTQSTLSASETLPQYAQTVIIGGGSIGCSIAWHLAKDGMTDVVLLEKNELTSGSTWHAAGNCPNFVGSWTVMKMQHYSTELYRKLGELTDYPMNYHVTGSVRLAHSRQRMEEFEHVRSMGKQMGFSMEMMSNQDMKDVYPFLETHDLEGGLWDSTDGDIDPAQLSQAFAKGARDLGAKIVRFCPVTNVTRDDAKDEWQITTPRGEIRCQYVVNAAGYRAAELGKMFGRDVPCISLAHQYLITESIGELSNRDKKLPLLRDPDSSYYLRQEKDGLLLGPYEKNCKAHWVSADDQMPEDFSFQLYPDDLERLEWYIEDACARVPILGTAGITRVVNGPIPYTPDGLPLIGPMPGVKNAFEACVFTFGIVQAGGAGKLMSEWIIEGETETDSWAVDPRRFTDHVDSAYAEAKAIEVYSHEYAIHFPHIQWPAGRDVKTGAFHDWHIKQGAEMGVYGGWERAEYYPDSDFTPEQITNYDHQPFFDIVGAECAHVQQHVGMLDLPGFSRYEVSGDGAAAFLDRLMTNKLPATGRTGLAYFASEKGKILSELSVTRFDDNHFWLIAGAGAYWHDRDALFAHIPDDGSVTITDKTREFSTLLITGPKARTLLSAISDTDFGADNFGWLTHQTITIAGAELTAIRVSFTGELGWELHIPYQHSQPVFDAVIEAGKAVNLKPFGMLALDSMRLEKGYRSWKGDLTSDYNMFDAGLGRWVHLSKEAFVGKQALTELKTKPHRHFVTLAVDNPDDNLPFGDAIYLSSVMQNSNICGLVLSAGYGHRTGQSLALSVLEADTEHDIGTEFEVNILGRIRKAKIVANANVNVDLYDPSNQLLKA
ncbi:MAG: GcvT family protein [Candidatus Puniceispirillaceae bacterium]